MNELDADFSWPLRPHADDGVPDFTLQDPAAPVFDRDIVAVRRARVFGYVPARPIGCAALVLAGGGYTKLVAGYEGVEVAHWLNSLGIHAFVLVHRFPTSQDGAQAPVDDAIEAMRQIRSRAPEWQVDPARVGVVGLSSGGHLAACLVANYPPSWRAPPSSLAHVPHRPDFLVVGYGPISTNAAGRTVIPGKAPLPPPEKQALYDVLQPDAHLAADPPPAFLVYSAADAVVPVENAFRLSAALRAGGGRVDLHVFAQGAHGFALREKRLPIRDWPALCAAWLATA